MQPNCKMWSCSYCANNNKLMWKERVRYGVEWYQQNGFADWSFLTITMSKKTRGFRYSISKWPGGWARLSARMRRKYKGIRYVLLPEQHDDFTLHTHALTSHVVSNTWISQNAHLCGLGQQSEAKRMYTCDKAAWYVSKYLGKTLGVLNWPRGFRRIRTSQHFPHLPDDDTFTRYDVQWKYHCTYSDDGLEYLAEGLTKKTGVHHQVI